jgi:Peptidase C13 family
MPWIRDTLHNLKSGLRFVAFGSIPTERALFIINADQLALLACLDLGGKIALDFAKGSPDSMFNFYALPIWCFYQCTYVVLTYGLAKAFGLSERWLAIMVIGYAALPVTILLELTRIGIDYAYANPSQLYLAANSVWLIYSLATAFWIDYQASRLKRYAIASVSGVIALALLGQQYWSEQDSQFWNEPYPNEAAIGDQAYQDTVDQANWQALDIEHLLSRQPTLLQNQLSQLKPQQANRKEWFFVGFAPFAAQDVFMQEINFAKTLMDKRFDTEGHSINLVNNIATYPYLPLATLANLETTLETIGHIMDKQNDVLVLYLTSHGSAQHHLSIEFGTAPLNDLTPQQLKQLLDTAGIKRRVIIVSACYSGGFLPELADKDSIVATAAAADKTSFGCSSEADFTYYGEALFRQHLAHSDSLIEALQQTVGSIAERERENQLEPSNPQLYIGSEIKADLPHIRQP